MRKDAEPNKDIKDDSVEEDDAGANGERMGDSKVYDKYQHEDEADKQIQGENDHHWNEKAFLLTLDSVNEATRGHNHHKAEDEVRDSQVEVDLDKVPYFILVNIHYLPHLIIQGLNF